jgi:hypothetical protein
LLAALRTARPFAGNVVHLLIPIWIPVAGSKSSIHDHPWLTPPNVAVPIGSPAAHLLKSSWINAAAGVAVGVAVGVSVGVGVEVGVGVGVGVGIGVSVGVGVGVSVDVGVAVGVDVAVAVGVTVAVPVGVGVGV